MFLDLQSKIGMEHEEGNNDCIHEVKKCLEKNQIKEAFGILDTYLQIIGISDDPDLLELFVSTSARYHRAENRFQLGALPWEQYDLSSSQVISQTLYVTKLICNSMDKRSRGFTVSFSESEPYIDRILNELRKIEEVNKKGDIKEAVEVLIKEIASLS